MEKKKPPLKFTKLFIRIFFDRLQRKKGSEETKEDIQGYENRGYDMDGFYWMYPELKPTPKELESILRDNSYELDEEEIKDYSEKYKRFYLKNEEVLPKTN